MSVFLGISLGPLEQPKFKILTFGINDYALTCIFSPLFLSKYALVVEPLEHYSFRYYERYKKSSPFRKFTL